MRRIGSDDAASPSALFRDFGRSAERRQVRHAASMGSQRQAMLFHHSHVITAMPFGRDVGARFDNTDGQSRRR